MSFTVIVGNLWGYFTGEWKGAPVQSINKMKTGLAILMMSIIMVAISKFYL
jgi:hypothetical protein